MTNSFIVLLIILGFIVYLSDYYSSKKNLIGNLLKIVYLLLFVFCTTYLFVSKIDYERINNQIILLFIFFSFFLFIFLKKKEYRNCVLIAYFYKLSAVIMLFYVCAISLFTLLFDIQLMEQVRDKKFTIENYNKISSNKYNTFYWYEPNKIPRLTNRFLHKKAKNGDIDAIDLLVRNGINNSSVYNVVEDFNESEFFFLLNNIKNLETKDKNENNYQIYINAIERKLKIFYGKDDLK